MSFVMVSCCSEYTVTQTPKDLLNWCCCELRKQWRNAYIFGRPFVKRFALCYLTTVCLSVTLVYYGQTVGWIRMPHAMEVGLGPCHTVRWGPSSPSQKGRSPNFRPCQLWPNGWTNQDATWFGGRPWPRPRCVRREPSSPHSQKGTAASPSPFFNPWLLWPNGRPSQQLLSCCCSYHTFCTTKKNYKNFQGRINVAMQDSYWRNFVIGKWTHLSLYRLLWV